MSCNRTVKIKLHGYLKDLYPGDIELSGYSVNEILNGLGKQIKELSLPPGEKHRILIPGFITQESLFEEIPENVTELHLVPNIAGAGGVKNALVYVAVGVVFIVAAVVTAGGAAALLAGTGGLLANTLFGVGVSMIMGGVMQMLSPAPKIDNSSNQTAAASDPEASKYLGATQNTVKIGTRIPILYGKHIAYGHYISFDVDAVDIMYTG